MFTLVCVTRPRGKAAFFSHNDYLLTEYMVNKTIREVVREIGEDSSRYSSHSIRIGGATLLAAAHFPDYIIQNMGVFSFPTLLTLIPFNDVKSIGCFD